MNRQREDAVAGGYDVDGRPTDAAAFIRTACDPQASVVVEACAGSGKTWLLVARMLRLLLAGCEPASLLAITFTRKAAQEMQERLLALLRELALASEDKAGALLRERGIAQANLAASLPLARGLYERVLASPQALSIDTFHSWFGRLLQVAPLASGVPHGYSLTEETAQLLDEATVRFMASLNEPDNFPVREALQSLYAQVGDHQAQRLLAAFVDKRAEWWAACLDGAPLPGLAELCGDDALQDPRLSLWQDAPLMARITHVARVLGRGSVPNQKRAIEIDMAVSAGPSTDAFDALGNAFFDDKGNPRRNGSAKALLVALSTAPAGISSLADFEAEFDAIAEALLRLRARSSEAEVLALNTALMTVAPALIDAYQALKAERRVFDFADLEWHVYRLLGNTQHAAYLQSRLDARYRHVLLDEFQDTNPLQWSVVRAWLESYGDDASRPSVFIVGDPKQSIYRFRRAEPRVFVAARAMLLAQGARLLRTSQTRRNAAAITDVLNLAFAENPLYFPQTTLADAGGAVWRLPLAGQSAQTASTTGPDSSAAGAGMALRDPLTMAREEEDDLRRRHEGVAVARALHAARAMLDADADASSHAAAMDSDGPRRACRWSDIMLLVKKRAHLGAYERALREAGIPFVSDKRGGLLESLESSDMVALLTLLITPGDNRALAHVLKSPIFAAADADLIQLAARSEPTWWARLGAAVAQGSAAPPLARAVEFLARWRQLAPRLPVHDLLDVIFAEGNLVARYAQAAPPLQRLQVVGNLHAFIGLSLALDAGRYPSLPKFIDALGRLQDAARRDAPDEAVIDAGIDAVRILTIHSAKGLEAPVVVLLDANHSEAAREDAGMLCVWPQDAPAPTHFSAFGRRAARGLARADHFADEDRLRAQEDWNLLYVATTRARRLLIVSGVAGSRGAGPDGVVAGSWYARLGMVEAIDPSPVEDGGAGCADSRTAAVSPAPAIFGFSLYAPTPVPADAQGDAAARLPTVEAQAAIDEGLVLHGLMERITADASWPIVPPPPALVAGWLDCSADQAALACLQAGCILSQPTLQRFFDPAAFVSADNELELLVDGAVLRIDRVVRFHDAIWILDYKRSADQQDSAGHRRQLDGYRRALQAVAGSLPVHTALVTADGRFWPFTAG